jgi:hypothetical protein
MAKQLADKIKSRRVVVWYGELFASGAVAMLHEAASGALRDVDRLATSALREAARRKKKLVERDVLARLLDAEAQRPGEPS